MTGLVDLHIHGQGGLDAMSGDPSDLLRLSLRLSRQGVVGFLPTFASAPRPHILRCLEIVKKACGRERGAKILGVHLEGPFLNPEKRGSHDPRCLRLPSLKEAREWVRAGDGLVRLVTIAPELPGALPVIRYLVSRGVRVSLGHSLCTFAQAGKAKKAGASSVTHLFNAMALLHHREPGLAGFALSDREIYTELIADGHHVSEEMSRWVLRCRPGNRILLVSDSLPMSKTRVKETAFGGRRVHLGKDGTLRTKEGALAGSNITLREAVDRMGRSDLVTPHQARMFASENPLRMLGIGS